MQFDPEKYTQDLRESWTQAAPRYDQLSSELFGPLTEALLALAGLREGQKVLDVACGPGTATAAAARAVGRSGKAVGVDLSPGMLKLAASRAGEFEPGRVEFREMNAEALDFPEGIFDAVICQLGLMLFAKPAAALEEMVRVAKKGAGISCLVQGTPEGMVFTSLLMKALVKRAPQIKVPGAPTLYTFGGPGTLEAAMAAAGLEDITSLRRDGIFTFPSPQAYWDAMTDGGGRTRALLNQLPPEIQEAVRQDVVSAAEAYMKSGRLELPYEVVLARGVT